MAAQTVMSVHRELYFSILLNYSLHLWRASLSLECCHFHDKQSVVSNLEL